tara:strand:+ start:3395 stop:3604 length:210 start_codon:yes stop_codon:yes gene_type:complete
MKDSIKNNITNIIGLVLLGINTYCYYWHHCDVELPAFLVMLSVSLALFLFKADQTKEWLKKVLSKLISK